MNKLFKNRKLAIALIMALALIMTITVTAFAEGAGGDGAPAKSYWDDPLFFEFIFMVVAFLSVTICSLLIYQAIKNRNKEIEYEEREGTCKLYEDLDDAKWDAPDSVFVDALEPTAAILSELEPVKPIRGLENFVITEEPIEPIMAMNIGADPYVFRRAEEVSNSVYEATAATPITLGDLDSHSDIANINVDPNAYNPFVDPQRQQPQYPYTYENIERTVLSDDLLIPATPIAEKPIEPATTPYTSPYTYIAPTAIPGAIPFTTPVAGVYEDGYKPTILEDEIVPVAELASTPINPAVAPQSNPVSFLTDVPITIYTSADEDGVVQINATILENTITATELVDEPVVIPTVKPEPVAAATEPSPSTPITYIQVRAEEPIEIPATEANVFENNIVTVALEDEPEIPVAEAPIVIPGVVTPVADPVVDTFAYVEEPVVIPATEANVFEHSVATTSLEDEPEIPVAEAPIVIPGVVTPVADPVVDTFAYVEEPVVIPATEANVFENNIVTVALEDEPEIPVAEAPIVIPGVVTPVADPVVDTFAYVEEPVVIPATEANVFENNIVTVALEDEPEIPVAKAPIVIPGVVTPVADPVVDTFAYVEEPVVIPATEANVFEHSVATTSLEDEPEIPVAEAPVIIPGVVTPAADPVVDTFAYVEEPVVIPATEANVFEHSVATTSLEDEPEIPVAEAPVIIPGVVTPAADPVVDTFAYVEEPVVIPATEVNVFEHSVATTSLEDEIVIEPVAVVIPAEPATEPSPATPITYIQSREETPVEIPTTEAAVFEQNVLNTVLADEATIPVVETPVIIPVGVATTPTVEPATDLFANVEAPVEIPTTEAAVFEQNVLNTVLADEATIPVVETPVIIPVGVATTPTVEPATDLFANVEAPVVIPTTEANVFEHSVATTSLEDEIVIEPVAVVIPAEPATEPSPATPITYIQSREETPVEIPTTEAAVFEQNVLNTVLEDEPEIPVAEAPVIIPGVVTPVADPVVDTFTYVEEPVVIPATEANVFENNIVTVALEDEPEIPVAEAPIVIPGVVTPAADPVVDTFAYVEEPVVIPATEANVFEHSVATTSLEDEPEIPVAEAPVIIPGVVTPAADPVVDTFAYVEDPVVIPATEANVFENNVITVALEDEPEIPVAEAPVIIPGVVTPVADPVVDTFAYVEEPVVIPATEAAVFEHSVATTSLEDEIVIEPVAVVIPAEPATEPSPATPITYIQSREETPVEIPTTEAAVFEQNVLNTVLADEATIPVAETPVIIPVGVATTPAVEPATDLFANVEAPVEIPTTEAAVFEQNVLNTVLEDEATIPVAETPVIIPVGVATTPAVEPATDLFANVEAPVEIPTTEAAVFEQNVLNTVLEDAAEIPVVEENVVVIPAVATPVATPATDLFADVEAPVEIPTTEAAVFEQNVLNTVLADEATIPVAETPVIIPVGVATTPAVEPATNLFANVEAPVEIPTTEAAVFEQNILNTVLEDAAEIPVVEENVVVIPAVATPVATPATDLFADVEAPVEIPTTEAAVFEQNVLNTVLADEATIPVAETPVIIPVGVATTPAVEPATDLFANVEAPVEIPTTEAAVFEQNVLNTVLEDEATIPVAETPVIIPVGVATTPAVEPATDLFANVEAPVEIPTTEAAVFEQNVLNTVLADEATIPVAETPVIIPVGVATTPAVEPATDLFANVETPVEIPTTEAAVFEQNVLNTVLADEATIPVAETPVIIPVGVATTPAVEPATDLFANIETPVEIPTTEAAVFEQNVLNTVLADEATIPVAETPVIIPVGVATTPAVEPANDLFANVEAPVEIPTTEAAVFEQNVLNTVLEDVAEIPVAETPVIIPVGVATTPAVEPAADLFANVEAPVEIPTTEAAVFEQNVLNTVLEDAAEIPVVEENVVVIPAVATPVATPATDLFANVEAPVEIPTTEAAVFEQNVLNTVLADEATIPVAETPVIIPVGVATTPAVEPAADLFANVEAPVEIPTTEAAVFEQNVLNTVLADEATIPVVETPVIIPVGVATTPAVEPATDLFANVETPVEIPTTEAAVFEQNVLNTVLADEATIPVVETPVIIPVGVATTPAVEPATDLFANVEAPVEISTTEAAVFEQNVLNTVLADKATIPVAETPVIIPVGVATTPAVEPAADLFANVETPVEIPTTEAAVFEQNVLNTVLADEATIPVAETPVIIPVGVATTPAVEPATDLFANVEAPVEIPTTEAAVFEQNVLNTVLEDATEIPVVEENVVVIPAVATPVVEPATDLFANVEAPVEIPTTEAVVFEQNVLNTVLEDEATIPVAETPVIIPVGVATTPAVEPATGLFANVEAPVEIPTTEAAVYENNVAATVLENAPEIITEVAENVEIADVVTPNAAPVVNLFATEEEQVIIPVTEAAVYENNVAATVLEDAPEIITEVAETVEIADVVTPNAAPVVNLFATEEEQVIIPVTEAAVYENNVAATVLEDAPEIITEVAETVEIADVVTPNAAPVVNLFATEEEQVIIPVTEAAVYENNVAATVLEDAPEIITEVADNVEIADVVTPNAAPVVNLFATEEEQVIIPVTEAAVYENNVAATVLEDAPAIPVVVESAEINGVITPEATPIIHTIVAEEKLTIPVTKTVVYESDGRTTVITDEKQTEETRGAIVEEKLVEVPAGTVVFESQQNSTLEDADKKPVSPVERAERTATVKAVRTTIVENDEVIAEITEYKPVSEDDNRTTLVDEPADRVTLSDEPKQSTILDDEKAEEETHVETLAETPVVEKQTSEPTPEENQEEPERKTPVHISTIPTTQSGKVKHETPMISTIPPVKAKGVGSAAAGTPFVLPATEEGRRMMATYAKLEEKESSFDSALRQAAEIPVAPMIDANNVAEPKFEPAPAPAPDPTPTPTGPNVFTADSDVEILFDGDNEPMPEAEPEIVEEPVVEPETEEVEEPVAEELETVEEPVAEAEPETIEEPETVEEPTVEEPETVEEPVAEHEPEIVEEPETIEEPVVEEPVVMPIEEPVFTDAERADELMTDEEAEQHIEILEEEPGKERSGKMAAINLDTICDSFEDGETVSLESLKEKKLISNKMGRVKILARGTMTKKLDIVADNFSLQAVKMITLAGGRAEQYK